MGRADPRGEGRSKRHARAERELPRAQDLEDAPAPRRPRTGRAIGIDSSSALTRADGVPRAPRGGARAARQHPGLQRVDQRVPGRLDDVLVDADRAPRVRPVGRVEQHARRRAGRLPLVEDADLVVDEADVAQVRVALADRVAQRAVERVDRAVALRRAHVALAVDPDLDRRLGLDRAVLALLGDHAPGLQAEQRLVVAGLAPDQQVERAVGGLELEAAVLERLDALDHARGAGASSRRRRCARERTSPCRESSETSTSRALPTAAGSMCSNVAGSALTPATCMPPLCANAFLPDVGLVRGRA